jgi:hypothetical protein
MASDDDMTDSQRVLSFEGYSSEEFEEEFDGFNLDSLE